MNLIFPRKLESGQRVAIVLTPAGADTEFYVIDKDMREPDVRERLDGERRLAQVVTVE